MAIKQLAAENIRLVAYSPFGDRRGVTTEFTSLEYTNVLNGLPTLKASLPDTERHQVLLAMPCEIAVEVQDTNGGWVEPDDCRFLVTSREWDEAELGAPIQFTALGFGQVLRWATVWDPTPGNADYRRVFPAQTPGNIIGTLVEAARARTDGGYQWCKGLEITGGMYSAWALMDSNGERWPRNANPTFSPSDSLEKVVEWFAKKGALDWNFYGRNLGIYRDGGVLAQTNSSVSLRSTMATAAPVTVSYDSLATVAKFHGDQGYTRVKHAQDASGVLGRVERWSEQGQVTVDATAELYLDEILVGGKKERVQWRREYAATPGVPTLWADYELGQWVPAGETGEPQRLVEVGFTVKHGEPVTGFDTLGTRLESLLEKLARHTTDLSSGMVGSDSGRPAPLPVEDEGQVPVAPTGLVCTSDVVTTGAGVYRAVVSCSWQAVDKSTTGQQVSVERYEMLFRTRGQSWDTYGGCSAGTAGQFFTEPGMEIEVRVRAVLQNGTLSALSAPFSLKTGKDTTPPEAPSAPVLSEQLTVITAKWDGLDNRGERMPPDFVGIEVYVGQAEVPDKPTATVAAAGEATWNCPVEPGTWWVGFRAFDQAGNRSGWSKTVNITVGSLVDTEAIKNEFDATRREIDTARARTEDSIKKIESGIRGEVAANKAEADKQISDARMEASRALTETRAKTTITRSSDKPSQSGTTVGDLWLQVDSQGSVIAQWVWTAANKWESTPIKSEAITNLTVDKLTVDRAGFTTAVINKLAADYTFTDKLIAHKVLIGGPNLVRDPGFTKTEFWQKTGGTLEFSQDSKDPWIKLSRSDTTGSTVYNMPWNSIPVNPGEKYYVSFEGKTAPGIVAGRNYIFCAFRGRKKDNSVTWPAFYPAVNITDSWQRFEGEITVPADTAEITFYLAVHSKNAPNGEYYFRNPVLKLKAGADLIVDGAITAQHIAALSITADKLAANSITADKIKAGAVNAQHIAAGAITARELSADAIDGKTITGPVIQGAKGKQGWYMDSERGKLILFDRNGNIRWYVDEKTPKQGGQDKDFSTSTFNMTPGGAHLVCQADEGNDNAFILLRNKTTADMNGTGAVIIAHGNSGLQIRSGTTKGNPQRRIDPNPSEGMLNLGPGGQWSIYNSGAASHNYCSITALAGKLTYSASEQHFTGPIGNPTAHIFSGKTFQFLPTKEMGETHPALQFNYLTPGTGGWTLTCNDTGWVFTSSSASKYKLDQKVNVNDPYKLLNVQPKTWVDKAEFERYAQARERIDTFSTLGRGSPDEEDEFYFKRGFRRTPGLVAEDVEAAGLEEFVLYDRGGDISGIYYDRLWTLLIPICRDLKNRLDVAEATIKKLQEKEGN